MIEERLPGARRKIAPGARRRGGSAVVPSLSSAMLAARRLEVISRRCLERLSSRDAAGARLALGSAFDALEAIEAGLEITFPPVDPGRPG